MSSSRTKKNPTSPRSSGRVATLRERNCSVGRTIDIIGDAWTFMILRECFFGIRTFEKFKSVLELPRATLSVRLKTLTTKRLLRQVPYSTKPLRYEYRLTQMGLELYPVMLALMRFGDRWLSHSETLPMTLIHIHSEQEHRCIPEVICSHCKEEIRPERVTHRPGPGAGSSPIPPGRKGRRATDPTALERTRPSSVARTLQVIGDRWSFMIIREGFFRVRRFDDFEATLGIAPNILIDRLNRLVAEGVFHKETYQYQPERFEYKFTEKGKDLFGSMMSMLQWGDKWLSGGEPPLILNHLDCGHDFTPIVACQHCTEPVDARKMRYIMHYPDPAEPQ